MTSDAKGDADDVASLPAWCSPARAKDLDGIGGEIVRGLVEAGAEDELKHTYGISLDEAMLSLHCAELAALRAWDLEAIAEAATVYQLEQLRQFGDNDEEARAVRDSITRISRQVRLATLAEGAAVLIHPADAVMLLERSGISVFYELRDAVSGQLGGRADLSEEDWERMKRLAGVSRAQDLTPSASGTQKKLTSAQEAELVALYDRGRGESVNQLAVQFGVSRPTIDKALKRAGVKG